MEKDNKNLDAGTGRCHGSGMDAPGMDGVGVEVITVRVWMLWEWMGSVLWGGKPKHSNHRKYRGLRQEP